MYSKPWAWEEAGPRSSSFCRWCNTRHSASTQPGMTVMTVKNPPYQCIHNEYFIRFNRHFSIARKSVGARHALNIFRGSRYPERENSSGTTWNDWKNTPTTMMLQKWALFPLFYSFSPYETRQSNLSYTEEAFCAVIFRWKGILGWLFDVELRLSTTVVDVA